MRLHDLCPSWDLCMGEYGDPLWVLNLSHFTSKKLSRYTVFITFFFTFILFLNGCINEMKCLFLSSVPFSYLLIQISLFFCCFFTYTSFIYVCCKTLSSSSSNCYRTLKILFLYRFQEWIRIAKNYQGKWNFNH